ncbi:conserved exported hypothetical protein [Candidatus Sulfopaludibacter sp. SbA3]|nr:conserved exported hypothetical protein [Candidatus Sulfopaludibacter sp. SbA3]
MMNRRTLLRWLATIPIFSRWAWAQSTEDLRALAAIVLPAELGVDGIRRVADAFAVWVRDYRPGAGMDHGYGFTRLRTKPPSPAATYLKQLQELRGGGRDAVLAAMEAGKITAMPMTPDGRHVASDLMAFYFRSSEANDLCYRAAIGRDQCRGLAGSDQPPAPLKGKA